MEKDGVELSRPRGSGVGPKLQDAGKNIRNVLRAEMLLSFVETQE